MRTPKSIADDFLKRKAQTDAKALKETEAEKAEVESAEAEKADELIKAVIVEKLKEVEAEAEKPSDFEVHTTKPMKEKPLEVHTVEPVIPIEEKTIKEPVKKVVKEPVKKVVKEPVKKNPPVERRRLNLMPPFSPFERRRSRIL